VKRAHTTTQIFAKEGYKYFLTSFIVIVLGVYWQFSALTMLILGGAAAALLYFFRNPERIAEDDSTDAIISPCDGIVVAIDKEYEESFLKEDCIAVTIATTIKDAHFVRAPFPCRFRQKTLLHGLFLPIKNEKARVVNERFAAFFESTSGSACFVLSIIAGSLATKISLYPEVDKKIRACERVAFLKSEFQTVLYLPISTQIVKSVGDKVLAGESLLGHLKSA